MSIHKKRRKVEICHNCHTILSLDNNFCPHCGQENHDLKVPIGHLAFEVFEGFTHFDTKFYNTMRAIFTSPGKITKDFLEGRRGRYVPPVRLYFLIAFVFFLGLGSAVDLALERGNNFLNDFKDVVLKDFVVTKKGDKVVKPKKELEIILKKAEQKIVNIQKSKDTVGLFKVKETIKQAKLDLKLYDDLNKEADNLLNRTSISVNEILDEMNIQRGDTLRMLISDLSEEKQRKRLIDIQKQIITDTIRTEPIAEVSSQMRDYFTEVIGKKNQLTYSLNPYALKNNTLVKVNYATDTTITIKGSDGSLQNTASLRKIYAMSSNELDSLNSKPGGTSILFSQFLSRGFKKNQTYYLLAFNEDAVKATSELAHLFVNVLSIMMFILMPVVALLLKLIYSKSGHSIIFYPIRLIIYLWDWLLFLLGRRKVRKHKRVPHLMFGQTKFYYEHLIFSIHIHAVLFLFLIIFVGGGIVLGFWKYALMGTLLMFIIYIIISLKTVYRQGIFKTLFKSVILFALYFVSFMTVLILTSAIKFALS